jgi:large subunit ribosomal protein L28
VSKKVYFCTPKKRSFIFKKFEMSRVCQITGKKAIVGNHVSHSNIKSKRRFNPNLHNKKFYVPELGGWVMLKVSAKGIRNINKKGAWNAIVDANKKGILK